MRKTLLALTLALGLPLALGAGVSYNIIVNGQVARGKALVVGAETYVPLSALRLLGVTSSLRGSSLTLAVGGAGGPKAGGAATAAGGSNQLAALEGCVGQTLFDGVWRFKVTSFVPVTKEGVAGWAVNIELRNATQGPLLPFNTGMANGGRGYSLLPPSGNSNVWESRSDLGAFAETDVPQAGFITFQLDFMPTATAPAAEVALKPTKFVLRIDSKNVSKNDAPYSVPDPSFRVRLDCQK